MQQQAPVILWFRQDLRIHDNPALYHAVKENLPILFLYIFDDSETPWQLGAASKWWLHHSLLSLSHHLLHKFGAPLVIKRGDPLKVLQDLHHDTGFTSLYWNRCYEPHHIARDQQIKFSLKNQKINCYSFNGALLKEPWEIQNQSKQYFKVFTPFWRFLQKQIIREIYVSPKKIPSFIPSTNLNIEDLGLLPAIPWYTQMQKIWQPGEQHASKKLKTFLTHHLKGYKNLRDRPDVEGTSRLSPHLHFGEISPVQIWHAVQQHLAQSSNLDNDAAHFLSELAWREFSYHLLYHCPTLPDLPVKSNFGNFPWKDNQQYLQKWQQGLTGYPIVDAGMQELWHTGWMHNRVRMITASFLIKDLLQPWQRGEAWFWDTLVDADLANNAASWQWVAGSGADAAPYFRIFNPVLQGKKFDPDGKYITKWLPALKNLPLTFIHEPWTAPKEVLLAAGIELGKSYPLQIIDHAVARKYALEAYKKIKL